MVKSGDMLIGEFQAKLEAKNRIALPKKFRDELGVNLVVTRGYESCLILVNESQFENLLKSVETKEFIMSEVRDTSRFLIGGASEVSCDKQGRFLLPKNLIQHAEIEKDLVFIGLNKWIEIWSSSLWNQRLGYLQENSEKIARDLSKMQNG